MQKCGCNSRGQKETFDHEININKLIDLWLKQFAQAALLYLQVIYATDFHLPISAFNP